jgi:hypothetical protein
MKEEKHIYQSDALSLPHLKLVLGEVPQPDVDEKFDPYFAFGKNKSKTEARNTVVKLIKHLEK